MLRFKNETGKEVTEIDGGLSDLCTYLYCCVVSASKREGKSFDMSLMDFADSISPEDMDSWSKTIQESAEQTPEDGDDSEKKSL